MLENYLKIALRMLRKHKGYSVINITGLAVGLAACILILLYVQDELSYDRYHDNADRIYRVALDAAVGGQFIKTANTSVPLGPTFVEEFPEAVGFVRFKDTRNVLISYEHNTFYETGFLWADSTVFDVFNFPLVAGDARTALTQPNTVVITREIARKYFGSDDPLGKTLRLDNQDDYSVTGILADIPSNSHFRFDILASFVTHPDSRSSIWLNNSFQTYLLLQESIDPAQLEAKIPALIKKYVAPQVEQALGVSFDEAVAAGTKWGYFLTPVTDIYLRSVVQDELGTTSDIAYVYILSAIAVFILLIACINFMNLSTARSANRAREVGMRKVLGSTRKQLVRQFLGESILIALLALGLALLLAELALPAFRAISGKAIPNGVLVDLPVVGTLLGIAVIVGILAGLYPAFVLSAFQPAAVLKGSLSAGAKNTRLRNVLVVAQFAISIVLLVGTGIVFNQLDFMQNKRMGFTGEQVVVLPIETDEARESFEAFRQALLTHSGVVNAVASSVVPGRFNNTNAFRPEGAPDEKIYLMAESKVSYDFLETFEIDLVAGRDFSRDFQTDAGEAYIINEAAAHELGLDAKTAPGTGLYKFGSQEDGTTKGTIIGIVQDFHFESLHQAIRPMVMGMQSYLNDYQYVSVRIRPDDVAGTLGFLEEQWKAFEPGYPYRYFFLDEDFGKLYQQERRLGQLFGYFTLLAVLVACLGLFGLASFVTEQRTKEIGVRKVLGASAAGIVVMLSKEFTKLVLVASVVAFPLAFFAMNTWLQNFAYRIDISWQIFLIAGLAALVIAWLTVSYQSIRAALSDPVKALRYE